MRVCIVILLGSNVLGTHPRFFYDSSAQSVAPFYLTIRNHTQQMPPTDTLGVAENTSFSLSGGLANQSFLYY